jgi:hypothetical protein
MKRTKFKFFKGFKGYSRSQTCSMTDYILNKINANIFLIVERIMHLFLYKSFEYHYKGTSVVRKI